jgi:glycosyltransferase involved in cell wall biosynthesis
MPNPKVSCYCATYGRTQLLEEAVYSFLMQDYDGEKELIILNDFSEQTIFYDHPEIKIINSKERINPLSKKFNECISYCSGEYIFVWEDDDIYLPWKISLSIKRLNSDGIFHTGDAFFNTDKDLLSVCSNLHHSSLCMSSKCWQSIGNYTVSETDKCNLDVVLFDKISKIYGNVSQFVKPQDIFYIYRFGSTQDYHSSMFPDNSETNVSDQARLHVQNKIKENKEPTGKIFLSPNWKYDYLKSRYECLTIKG